jgi:tetratricopeptide (TPR) repeat protein
MASHSKTVGKPAAAAPLPTDQLKARLHQAAVHRVEGRHDEAVALYEAVERSNPDAPDAPYFLALIDLLRDRPAPALKRLSRLSRRLPASFDVWQALAYAHRALGQWREAIAASRRALSLQPTNAYEQFELATALEVAGEMPAALEVLDGLAAMDDARLSALVRIARLDPSRIGPAEQAEIAAAALSPAEDAETRSSLNYALGEILERQGRYDEAFDAFAEGARLKRLILTGALPAPERPRFSPRLRALDPKAYEAGQIRQIGFMKAVFTPEFLAERAGRGHHLATPIFIVGMPRSGSTLIEQILSSHPRVQGLGETGALIETVHDQFPINLFAPEPPGHFKALAEAYLAAMHARGWGSSSRFIDKMLHNHLYIGMIHLMFPKAVILHSVRDAADTCFANFRQSFAGGNEASYDLAEIGRDYVRYREMMAHWDEVLPGRVIPVEHEALVADPQARIRWLVTEACGLDWNEACLRFHETRRAVRTASVAQVRQPIFSTSVQRWRRYARRLGPLFDALGPYAPTDA